MGDSKDTLGHFMSLRISINLALNGCIFIFPWYMLSYVTLGLFKGEPVENILHPIVRELQ